MAAFGFFVGMAVFAKPVGMSFPNLLTFFAVLFALCCACAFLFYRLMPDMPD